MTMPTADPIPAAADQVDPLATAGDRAALLGFIQGYSRTQLVHVAARLGLADLLHTGPATANDLALRTGSDASALGRVLRGLCALGILTEAPPGTYAITPRGALLGSGHPDSLHGLALVAGAEWYGAWAGLPHTVATGETAFDHVYGRPFFDYLGRNPEAHDRFNRRMVAATSETATAVLAAYDFSGTGHVFDVGGGYGTLLSAILRAHPGLSGTLFDLASVVESAQPRLAATGLADRCAVLGGDFFTAVPPGGDTYLLSQILHDWDDADCVHILGNLRRAVPAHGRLLVVEAIMPERIDGPGFTLDMDLLMLVLTGGRERTEAGYRALFAAAGFELTQVIPTTSPRDASILEGRPL